MNNLAKAVIALLLTASFGARGILSVTSLNAQTTDTHAALLKQAQERFAPLPKDWGSPEFPTTQEKVALGRALFFDPRLTIEGNVSCATCHQPALYGTDGLPKSIGVLHRQHVRNAPSVVNTALNIAEHW